MKITDRILPTMTFGAPTTVDDFGLSTDNPRDRITDSGSDAGTVKLTASTTRTTFNVELSDDVWQCSRTPTCTTMSTTTRTRTVKL